MPSISVRNLPEGVHRALKRQAAEHGRSTEAEARAILAAAVLPPREERLGSALRRIGAELGLTEAFRPGPSPDLPEPAVFE